MAGVTGRKIPDAALNIVRTRGLDETTMHDVAAEAGVATGAILQNDKSTGTVNIAWFEKILGDGEVEPGESAPPRR